MVRVTSVPDAMSPVAMMVTVALELSPAVRLKLVGYVRS